MILFSTRTTIYAIPLSIFLSLIKFLINKNIKSKNIFVILFFIFYILLYFVMYLYAFYKLDKPLISRFFYWYTILKYLYKNPEFALIGLGEYNGGYGYLYKYLTFDLKEFSYINYVDYNVFYHSHAHNDIVSFIVGGGLIFSGIYFFIIYKILKINLRDNRDYILLIIFIMCILHGTTEAYALNNFVGYIFWFVSTILIFKYYDFYHLDQFLNIIKNKFKFRTFYFFQILIFIIIIITFMKLNIKYNFYVDHAYNIRPLVIKFIYNNKESPKNSNINKQIVDNLNFRINLIEFLKKISIVDDNYSILGDYFLYRFIISNNNQDLFDAYENYCKGFYLRANVENYLKIKYLINNQNLSNNSKYCEKLKEFDPFEVSKNITYSELFTF